MTGLSAGSEPSSSSVPHQLPDFVPDPPAEPPAPPADPPEVAIGDSVAGAMVSEAVALRESIVPNRVTPFTADGAERFEAEFDVQIVENRQGVIAWDTVDDSGARLRIVAYDAQTSSGVTVIGVAFLNQAEIDEVEAQSDATGWTLGPEKVAAHKTSSGHYHFQWDCSYAYQYANSNTLYVYICPDDVNYIRYVGSFLAGVLGWMIHPIVALLGVLVVNVAITYFDEPDGSIQFYVPDWEARVGYGSTYYYGPESWFYHYARSSSLYCWARQQTNGNLYYEC